MSISKKQVRVRFAPSPTGFLHIGGLRTALYNYLFAKKNKGKFLLRIEDTDRQRLVEGGVEAIIKTLNTVGLDNDEGPIKGGHYGPYIQSERLDIYKEHITTLLNKGYAYHCFCTLKLLEKDREEQRVKKLPTKYGGRCLKLTEEEINNKLENNEPHVIRLKVPETGKTSFHDEVYGDIEFDNSSIDHQVLFKSDGFPTYHLANVVDDHLMEISHVIRGEEWLPSTPKHILLYKAFGWELPKFAHLPLLLNQDRSKLSKRQGDVAVEDYLGQGFLPEVLINFVALLGWNPRGDQEIYTLKELIDAFDLSSINKGGAILNREKLYWMNGEYIKNKSLEELVDLCMPEYLESGIITDRDGKLIINETGETIDKKWLARIIELERERMKRIDEIPQLTNFLFKDTLDYEGDILVWKKSDKESTKNNLEALETLLVSLDKKDFKKEKLETEIKKLIEDSGVGNGDILWPMRVALSGLLSSPPPFEIAEILGKEKTIKRLKDAINKL